MTLLPAFAYTERRGGDGQFRGRVEALASVTNYLKGIRQDYVVLADSDTVMNLPLEDVFRRHIDTGADITAVCATGAGDGEDTYFTLDGTGRITDTAYALYTPAGYRCLNVFVLRRDLLLELVAECASRNGYSLRRNILQEMGARLKLYGYVYDGYAAHINTLQSYYDRSMELLSTAVRQALFCPQRPVYGKENDSPSGYIDPDGGCVNSLHRRRLRHPGQCEKLHSVPQRAYRTGCKCGKLYSVQGHGGEEGRVPPQRHHRQVCDRQRKRDTDRP